MRKRILCPSRVTALLCVSCLVCPVCAGALVSHGLFAKFSFTIMRLVRRFDDSVSPVAPGTLCLLQRLTLSLSLADRLVFLLCTFFLLACYVRLFTDFRLLLSTCRYWFAAGTLKNDNSRLLCLKSGHRFCFETSRRNTAGDYRSRCAESAVSSVS